MLNHRNLKTDCLRQRWWVVAICLGINCACCAQNLVFHLRNGDRITGAIVSESTNEVTIATPFGSKIALPLTQIERREEILLGGSSTNNPSVAKPPEAKILNAPGSATAPSAKPVARNQTAQLGEASNPKPAETKSSHSDFHKFLSDWKGEMDLGLNLGFSAKNRQAYSGRFKATHAWAMSNQRTLRNSLDYMFSYGRIDGILSDNRMDGSWKIDYDLGKRFLVYNAGGAGYDEIRKIGLQYDLGPGLGYKWLTRTNFVLETELGGNFQEQLFADHTSKNRYSMRVAENAWWQASSKLRLDEKAEFFPQVSNISDFRVRLETNTSYLLRNNLAVKLTVIDLYETRPASGVPHNDLQIRSSLEIRF